MSVILLALAACGTDDGEDQPAADEGDTGAPEEAAPEAEAETDPAAEDETADAAPYYEGRHIEWMVPYGPGGGNDTAARYMAQHLPDHIEGNPTIQVYNSPGAAGLTGMRDFQDRREADGTNLLIASSSSHFPYILGDPNVQFDLGNFRPVLGRPSGAVIYVHSDTGIQNASDLAEYGEPLRYAGLQPSGGELPRLLLFHLLDVGIEPVFGYDGRGAARLAFEQGESDVDGQTTAAYFANVQPMVDDGVAVPLMTHGLTEGDELIRDPEFPDLPHAGEVFEAIHGEPAEGPAWAAYRMLVETGNTLQNVIYLHKDVPDEAYQAMVAGFESMINDPDFLAEAEEAIGGYELIMGDSLEAAVDGMTSPDPEAIDWLNDFLLEEYDVEN